MADESIKISERLKSVAAYLPEGANFADIGSDHAYLPIYVCRRDNSAKAIAGEVNKGPYESARQNVKLHGLIGRIDVRLGDGLTVLEKGEIEQIVIAGMGGALIRSILEQGKSKISSVSRIIVQPNIDARNVRQWFLDNGYHLIGESLVEENNHIYEVLVADKGAQSPYNLQIVEKQLLFGPYLLQNKTHTFYKKWKSEKLKLQHILQQMDRAANPDINKQKIFRKELSWIEEVLEDERNSN